MENDLLDIIKGITDNKKSMNVEPSAALYSEISSKVHEAMQASLNKLVKKGKVSWHRTLNQTAFTINV